MPIIMRIDDSPGPQFIGVALANRLVAFLLQHSAADMDEAEQQPGACLVRPPLRREIKRAPRPASP